MLDVEKGEAKFCSLKHSASIATRLKGLFLSLLVSYDFSHGKLLESLQSCECRIYDENTRFPLSLLINKGFDMTPKEGITEEYYHRK